MTIKRSNDLPNIRDLFSYGEGKNFAFDNCMEFLMEKVGENKKLDYWIITGITGNGYTPVYSKNDVTTTCEYCVSGFLAEPDYFEYIFDAIGYEFTYVTSEQLNAEKPMYIQKLIDYIGRGIPVIAVGKLGAPEFDIDTLTHYLYVGQEDYEKTSLFSRKADVALYNELDEMEFIPQDWIFVGEKKCEIVLADIFRNAVMKIPYWLALPEQNGVYFGASAYHAWADDIEAGRYATEIDAWHNYGVYICNLATIAWANSINYAPYTSIVNRFAQIDPQYADMNARIARLYFKLGDDNGSTGISGIWKDLEDLGGGLNNYSRDTFRNKEKRARIAAKLREAADCIEEVVKCFK